jgi:DNA polymerase III subunit epsilon
MAILFFDTETTGLPDHGSPPGRGQPHIVQLAAVLVDGRAERTVATLIRPEGWTIHPDARRVHGISVERARAEGIPIAQAIASFDELLAEADLAVAHNVRFDRLLLDSEYARLARPPRWPRTFCTMLACTDILCLHGYRGAYKWPTLDEAYRHFCSRPVAGAHDALADVRACMAIYQELSRRGLTAH